MNISFKGIGDQYVTFAAAETAELGAVCKISANGTVDKCAADDAFSSPSNFPLLLQKPLLQVLYHQRRKDFFQPPYREVTIFLGFI